MHRVFFVCPWFGVFAGGAERAVRMLAVELRRRGVDAQVLTTCNDALYGDWTTDGLPSGPDECDGVPVERFPVNRGNIHLYHEAVRRWVSGKPVSTSSQYDFFSHGLSSDALVNFLGKIPAEVPIVTNPYFHALNFRSIAENPRRIHLLGSFHDEPQFYWKPVREMFDKARGVVFQAPEEKQLAIRVHGLRCGRALAESPMIGMGTELPHSVETRLGDRSWLDSVRHRFDLPRDFFIAVGRKEVAKGVSKLVEGYAPWAEKRATEGFSEAPLVFLGGGDDSLIPGNPTFRDLGFVREEEKFALMHQALATINLSAFEAFSFVVMESWLCGTPVIVSAACAVTSGHVMRSEGGFSVADGSELGIALDRLSHREFGQALGQKGREHVREEYNWDVVTDRFVRSLEIR